MSEITKNSIVQVNENGQDGLIAHRLITPKKTLDLHNYSNYLNPYNNN